MRGTGYCERRRCWTTALGWIPDPECGIRRRREAPRRGAINVGQTGRSRSVMFFRGRQPEASIWRRFRVSADGFTFVQEEDLYTAHVVANAERVVDLFYNLTDQMPPAVDLVIDDLRSGRSWKGES